jgi:UDP-N-acetylmuramate: L-alanyl-gamma-D-glutamyl-meso-diaminopimelate ligase
MNLENKVDSNYLLKNKHKLKKIFFYRICGTGMGACACLLKEIGYSVEGGDVNYFPPMSTYLNDTGVKCHKLDDITDEFLKDFDLIVVGNSVPRVSEYSEQVERCGIAFTSFPDLMGALVLRDKNVIGIAGTHGKTTTTYFLTLLLEELGKHPGYFIGGIVNGRPPSRLGKSDYFIIESDEYDSAYFQKISKFRLYAINHMILTSLEFDHGDIFETVEDIKDEFRAIFEKDDLKSLICDDSYLATTELIQEFKLKANCYSLDKINFIEATPTSTIFSIDLNGVKETFETNILGKQNILNIVSCILFLDSEGFELSGVKTALKHLELVKRRQEIKGCYKGSVVIDDFAHHPRAIELTIDSIKQRYQDKEIVVIFEPISATARSSIFQKEFSESLMHANKVILANAGVKTTAFIKNDLDFDQIVTELNANKVPARSCENLDQLRSAIDEFANNDNVLLILSNRTCLGLWESDFINEIK